MLHLPVRVEQAIAVLPVIDSYGGSYVSAKVLSDVTGMGQWGLQITCGELVDRGVLLARKGPLGGYARRRKVSLMELLEIFSQDIVTIELTKETRDIEKQLNALEGKLRRIRL